MEYPRSEEHHPGVLTSISPKITCTLVPSDFKKKKARCHLNGLYCKEALNSGHVISLKREREELYLSPRRCDVIVCVPCDNALWHFLNGGYGYCE